MIYESQILAIDEAKYFSDLTSAVQRAFNLSINAVYPTKATIGTLLAKAASESRNLAVNAEIIMPSTIDALLAKAN